MFSKTVDLYRELGRPPWADGRSFDVVVNYSAKLEALAKECERLEPQFGAFLVLIEQEKIRIEGEFPANEKYRFFDSVQSFIDGTKDLLRGDFRDGIYIREIDYSSDDAVEPPQIRNLKKNIGFIKSLRAFSSLNVEMEEALALNKLIFLRSPDGKSARTTVVVPLALSIDFSSFEVSNYSLLDALVKSAKSDKLHIEERVLLLNTAIADVLSDAPEKKDSLEFLARNWRKVSSKYFHDLQAYVNNFAFDAVRKKLADSAIENSTKFAASLNDLTAKLIAVPISLAALVALKSVEDPWAFLIGALGVAASSIICFLLVGHYKQQASHLLKIADFTFETYNRKIATFPKGMQEEIRRINAEISANRTRFNRASIFFYGLTTLPLFAVLLVAGFKFFELQLHIDLFVYCIG